MRFGSVEYSGGGVSVRMSSSGSVCRVVSSLTIGYDLPDVVVNFLEVTLTGEGSKASCRPDEGGCGVLRVVE